MCGYITYIYVYKLLQYICIPLEIELIWTILYTIKIISGPVLAVHNFVLTKSCSIISNHKINYTYMVVTTSAFSWRGRLGHSCMATIAALGYS